MEFIVFGNYVDGISMLLQTIKSKFPYLQLQELKLAAAVYTNCPGIIDYALIKIFHAIPKIRNFQHLLRLPDTYEAKIAKIGNFWTF